MVRPGWCGGGGSGWRDTGGWLGVLVKERSNGKRILKEAEEKSRLLLLLLSMDSYSYPVYNPVQLHNW